MDISEIKKVQSGNEEEIDAKVLAHFEANKTKVYNYDDFAVVAKELKLGQFGVFESAKRLWIAGKSGKIVINRKHYFGCLEAINSASAVAGVPVAKYVAKAEKPVAPAAPKVTPVTKK